AEHPNIGKQTSDSNVRFKVVREYLLFYEISEDEIIILTVWDNRQNPENLALKNYNF
ncbi:MAG: type II toxin-antitoxin system RelE/ParE family toxin, partial [Sphingobacteriales bacterium]